MQKPAEGAQTPYEVYCYDCRVTFPVEQKRCLHCGGRLGPRGETPFRSAGGGARGAGAGQRGGQGRLGRPGGPSPAGATTLPQEDEEEPSLALRRFGGLALWALIVVSALVSNLCSR